jgi:hypothetical protein
MDRYELELKRLLAHREPASDFTSRVMEQVRRESTGEGRERKVIAFQPRGTQRYWRWAAVGALAASLTVGVVGAAQNVAGRRRLRGSAALRRFCWLVKNESGAYRNKGPRPEE